MRRIFNLVVALLVLLVACVGVLLFRPSYLSNVTARLAAVLPESLPANDRASPFVKPEPKPTINAGPRMLVAYRSKEQPEPPPPATPTPSAAIYPFATSGRISAGTSKADLLAAFGPPQATATGADHGQLQERMIYRELPTRRTTVIALIDGRVTRAETFTAFEGIRE